MASSGSSGSGDDLNVIGIYNGDHTGGGDGADERQPWFSPDGRRVAYARYRWFPDQPFYEASEIMVVEVPS